ncbi:MAG: hypothetical protein VKJ04_07015 [Vampirovibrionales bacterium]|nr:hypothetical protein [Vampirovibrionales bacterium]
MKSWGRYQKRFISKAFNLEMSMGEKAIILALLGALIMNGCFAFMGRHIGDVKQIRLVKMRAEQELMVSKPYQSQVYDLQARR